MDKKEYIDRLQHSADYSLLIAKECLSAKEYVESTEDSEWEQNSRDNLDCHVSEIASSLLYTLSEII